MKPDLSQKSFRSLLVSLALLGHGCHAKQDSASSSAGPQSLDWSAIQSQRQSKLDTFLQENKAALAAFTKGPVGFNGTPALILRLLPDVVPELWNEKSVAAATGMSKEQPDDPLYYGMALTKSPAPTPSPMMAQFTCAACHTGQVIDAQGKTQRLVGAPSTRFDVNAYRSLLTAAIMNPNFNFEKFRLALLSKADGALYGADRIADEKMDKAIFFSGPEGGTTVGETIINQFKQSVLQRGALVQQTLGAYSYHGDMTLLKSSPGHVEAFGFATLAFMPQEEFRANPAAALQKHLGPAPSVADIMSVWRQDDRQLAQWDGNIRNKLIRNLGAELGIAGDPRVVNYQNALETTPFVGKLPAPVYPFSVDLAKAAQGRVIYENACASCHESEQFMGIKEVGTEPGRAIGLTAAARDLLVTNLKAACTDKSNPLCLAPDTDIIVPRQENPGYLALPLTGIWARAPYLHNGSVPTMAQLLIPESRAAVFKTGDLNYDQKQLGFNWTDSGKTYDTSILGYSNKGHADVATFNGGIDFSKHADKLEALLEYLKTL